MARSDYSRYDDEPRRSQGGLSLSTGRFDGRSTGTTRSSSSSGNRPRGTRHNPLRDEYPSSRDRRRESEPGRRHSGGERSTRGEQPRGKQTPAGNRGAQGRPRNGAPSGRGSHAPRAGAAFAPQMHTLAPAGGFNLARAAMALIAIALAVIFAMALFHIGPFASAAAKDGSKHVGVASANAVGGNASYFAQNVATQVSLARPVEPELAQLPAYTPTRDDLTNLAGQKAPFAFALGNATNDAGEQPAAPVLSDRSLVSLNNALSYYDNNGYEASYLIMDLGTGRGIAGNVDVPIYGASSFKGPYCAYVVNKEFPNDIDRASSSRLTQVENTIVWSDNSSYGKLRRTYGNDGMEAWLAEAGVDTALVNDTYFPTYTARQSALMWLKIYEYLTTADTSAASVALGHLRQDRGLLPAQRRFGHHERRAYRLPARGRLGRRGGRGRRRKRRYGRLPRRGALRRRLRGRRRLFSPRTRRAARPSSRPTRPSLPSAPTSPCATKPAGSTARTTTPCAIRASSPSTVATTSWPS